MIIVITTMIIHILTVISVMGFENRDMGHKSLHINHHNQTGPQATGPLAVGWTANQLWYLMIFDDHLMWKMASDIWCIYIYIWYWYLMWKKSDDLCRYLMVFDIFPEMVQWCWMANSERSPPILMVKPHGFMWRFPPKNQRKWVRLLEKALSTKNWVYTKSIGSSLYGCVWK